MSKIIKTVSRPQAMLVSGLLAAALNMGVSHQALAVCSNNPPATGQTVDCSGTGNDAVIAPTNATTGIGGVTDVNVNVPSGASITGVGQTVAGSNAQYSSVRINDGSTVTNNGTISPTLQPNKPRDYVGVNLNGSDTTLINNGTISLNNNTTVAGSTAYRLYGVITSVPGAAGDDAAFENVQVTNGVHGSISVTQSGTGVARGIYGGEGIDSMTVDNFGSISVTRIGGAVNTTQVGAVDSDDDVDTLTVNNHVGGIITATGTNTFAVGGRANEYTIINDGTITDTTGRAAILFYGVGDQGTAETTIVNSKTGIVNGNVVVSDGNPLGSSALIIGTPPATTALTRNSDITNAGTINGSVTLASGVHTLDNSGTITGGITVLQTAAVGVGGASFTLTNEAGAILGNNIAITDRADSQNSVTLEGTGFNAAGSITSTGHGAFGLTLDGVTNIKSASGVTTLDLMRSNVAVTNGVTLVTNTNNPTSQINTTIFGAGGTTVAPSTNLGSIQGTLTLNGAATNITPTFGSLVRNGDVYVLASAVNGSGTGNITADSTYLVSVTPTAGPDGLRLMMAATSDVSGTPGISLPATQTLNNLLNYDGSDKDVQALGGALQNLQTGGAVAKAGAQLAPETNYATQQAAITLNNAIGQHIDTRLNATGATGAFQGYTAGPYGLGAKPKQPDPNRSNLGGSLKDDADFVAPRSAALWGQAFGAGMDQSQRDEVDGYSARLYGVMVGYDNWVSPGLRVGVAGGYANTTIDGRGDTRQNETSIDSYLIEAYGAFKGDWWYASGRTGFTWHDYDTTRAMTVPFTDSAKGNHDGDQFNVSFEVGAPMKHAGTIITPVAGLTYSRLHQDGYSESSDGGMALDVRSQDNDSLVSSLGVKGLLPIANDTVIEGRALWLHEFSDDAQIVTASFAGGGGTFTAAGPGVGRDTADLGIGMLAQIGPNSTFEINYDANVRQDYLGQIGSARVDIHF